MNYCERLRELGYNADNEDTTTDEETTDEEEESEVMIKLIRNRNDLHIILNHAIKHPPNIKKFEFERELSYYRLSDKWNKSLERKYRKVLNKLKK